MTHTNTTEAKNGNCVKPLLSYRLLKFRARNTLACKFYKPTYKAYDGNLHDISITLNGFVIEITLDVNASMLNSKNYVLMQFTGLHDKNGKEIYEGDILCDYRLDGTYRMYKIFKSKGGFVFNTHQNDFKKPIDKILFTESCSDMQNAGFLETCEIEGNIFSYVL